METLALAPLAPRDLHGCFSPGHSHGWCWQDMGDTIPVDLNSHPPASELPWGKSARSPVVLAFSSFLHPASPGWTGSDNHAHKA